MPLVLMLLYLVGIGAVLLTPFLAARYMLSDVAIPVAANAGEARKAAVEAPAAADLKKPPVWIVPARVHGRAQAAQPGADAVHATRPGGEAGPAKKSASKQSKTSKPKKQIAGKRRSTDNESTALSYAPAVEPAEFPSLQRD